MASDALESLGQQLQRGNNVYVSVHPDTREDADRIFKGLSAGSEVESRSPTRSGATATARVPTSSASNGW